METRSARRPEWWRSTINQVDHIDGDGTSLKHALAENVAGLPAARGRDAWGQRIVAIRQITDRILVEQMRENGESEPIDDLPSPLGKEWVDEELDGIARAIALGSEQVRRRALIRARFICGKVIGALFPATIILAGCPLCDVAWAMIHHICE